MNKPALTIAGLALVAGSLSACSDGISTGASQEGFCGGFAESETTFNELDPEGDPEGALATVKEEIEKIRDTGVPDDTPDDAQESFDVSTQAILDVPDDADLGELADPDEGLSEDEQSKADAFDDYLAETCDQ